MIRPPSYFEEIASRSEARWRQLLADEELAAPWHQLFRQVQSPPHVLSELLQNAEDCEATWAKAYIENNEFVFEHNGGDFDDKALASLCRFGFSNKRSLHTIGFRGVGFKTTFSLGDEVHVQSPTLSFRFERQRFTLPIWEDAEYIDFTRMRVPLAKAEVRKAVESSLNDWIKSPIPLLFFSHIASLSINQDEIARKRLGKGPVPNSSWVELNREGCERLLLIRSQLEDIPEDAIDEIRRERNDPEFAPAACRVEVVFGLQTNGRLYAVLPTQVDMHVPFESNAPFLQDTARFGIKHPALSVTNSWLLKRVGKLIGESVKHWAGNAALPHETRSEAYDLLPDFESTKGSNLERGIREVWAAAVQEAFDDQDLILGLDGELHHGEDCADIPGELLSCLGEKTCLEVFGDEETHAIHPSVSEDTREVLDSWELIGGNDSSTILQALEKTASLPRPDTREKLLTLWATIARFHRGRGSWTAFNYPVVPIRGSDRLYRSKDVFRAGFADERLSADDLQQLFNLIRIADEDFLTFVEREREEVSQEEQDALGFAREALKKISFEPTYLQRLFETATRRLNEANPFNDVAALPLTRIAARADLTAPNAFRYRCRDGQWRGIDQGLLLPRAMDSGLLTDAWTAQRVIADEYLAEDQVVRDWLEGDKSGLSAFPIPTRTETAIYNKWEVVELAKSRGGTTPQFISQNSTFRFIDFDFPKALVEPWAEAAKHDTDLWARVVEASLLAWSHRVEDISTARVVRLRGAAMHACSDDLTPTWVHRLQQVKCLYEERSSESEQPSLLLRRTRETEPFLQTDAFVHHRLDAPEMAAMLDLLGVRDEPDNADRLIERLRMISKTDAPPIVALSDLYRGIGSVMMRLEGPTRAAITSAFEDERLIFGDDGGWHAVDDIYVWNEEDVPGVAVLHRELKHNPLWELIGVPKHPSLDVALDWLRNLEIGTELKEAQQRRLKNLLQRVPQSAWNDTEAWLSCTGTWESISSFYYYTIEVSERRSRFFPNIRRCTADFSMLSAEQVEQLDVTVSPLSEAIELRYAHGGLTEAPTPEWIRELAICVLRVRPSGDLTLPPADWSRLFERACALTFAPFRIAKDLRVAPYINGIQAGPEVVTKAIVNRDEILVSGAEHSYASELADRLEEWLALKELRSAIRFCLGRPRSWIEAYFEDHFDLAPREDAERELSHNTVTATTEKENQTEPVHVEAKDQPTVDERIDEPIAEEDPADAIVDIEELLRQASQKERARQRRLKPLHLFLESRGYQYDSDDRAYYAEDGGTVRHDGAVFPWTEYDAEGATVAHYLELSKALEDSPVLKAEEWLFIQRNAKHCWLVWLEGQDSFQIVRGVDIMTRIESGDLQAAAASYRLSGDVSFVKSAAEVTR